MKSGAHDRSRLWVFLAVAAIVILSGTQVQAADSSSSVRVSVDANNWTIHVLEPSSLRTVLDSVCRESQMVCNIAPDLKDDIVVPMIVQGTPTLVLSKLLEGIKVNYSYAPPGSKERAKLIIDNAPAGPDSYVPSAPSMASAYEVQAPATNGTAPSEPAASGMNANPSEPATSLPTTAMAGSSATASALEIPAGSQLLPFMGPHGRFLVIPAGTQDNGVSPFMDSRGNFVPISSNGGASVSPFLDGSGRFLPAPSSNTGTSAVSPFMDRNGSFLPVPSGSR
jgi:hypothetical protein